MGNRTQARAPRTGARELTQAIRIDEEIELVPLHAGFAPTYAEHAERDHERLGRWLAWVHRGHSADDVRAYIGSVEERRNRNLGDAFAIVVDGRLAGVVDIHDVNREHRVAALGYWLGSRYSGRGIMTRAVRTVTDLVFDEYKLHRLEILVAVENRASRAVAERAGFTQEAILRERVWAPHGYDDAALYVRFSTDSAS